MARGLSVLPMVPAGVSNPIGPVVSSFVSHSADAIDSCAYLWCEPRRRYHVHPGL